MAHQEHVLEHLDRVTGLAPDPLLGEVPEGEGMEAELLPQRPRRLVVALGDVDPDEAVVPLQQGGHVRPGALLNARR